MNGREGLPILTDVDVIAHFHLLLMTEVLDESVNATQLNTLTVHLVNFIWPAFCLEL